ncbi:hypothetical protein [Rubripirellula lacrimiformis]|uniref:hypothetical protein n=1 Tax=Rubripirellula lacrimiformis TaxID=1930273 RepID=UPI00119E070F|nr:hypothetical protein [Rubripirellula lacrimiformis]
MTTAVIQLKSSSFGKSWQLKMNVVLEKFDSGWVGLSLALGRSEIDVLIQKLNELKSGELDHFHFRCDNFDASEGVADFEITTSGAGDVNNLIIE